MSVVFFVSPDVARASRDPIEAGLPSDAAHDDVLKSLKKQLELNKILEPIVHRRDASELRKELPHMQQVVFHLRQSRTQSRLYSLYKKLAKDKTCVDYNNFFRMYAELRVSMTFISSAGGKLGMDAHAFLVAADS